MNAGRWRSGGLLGLGALSLLTACGKQAFRAQARADSIVVVQREAHFREALAHSGERDGDAPIARWELPARLKEISGLALTADGRLFTHGDERARIYQIDYRRGVIEREFDVGNPAIHGDFEAITSVGDSLYLMDSEGVLYHFAIGDSTAVPYTREDTDLGSKCEFEAMTFDPHINALLLGCKRVHDKGMRDSVIIFRWKIPHASTDTVEHIGVAFDKLVGNNGWDGVHPSDITIDPRSGNYVLVASKEKAIIEITPAGEVVFARPLPSGHSQPEGVAITRDGVLIVSDEGESSPGAITLYRWPR